MTASQVSSLVATFPHDVAFKGKCPLTTAFRGVAQIC